MRIVQLLSISLPLLVGCQSNIGKQDAHPDNPFKFSYLYSGSCDKAMVTHVDYTNMCRSYFLRAKDYRNLHYYSFHIKLITAPITILFIGNKESMDGNKFDMQVNKVKFYNDTSYQRQLDVTGNCSYQGKIQGPAQVKCIVDFDGSEIEFYFSANVLLD